jgi:hypothetical protein
MNMQFIIKLKECEVPGRMKGFKRTYYCADVDKNGEFFYVGIIFLFLKFFLNFLKNQVGTKSGEIIIFSLNNSIFRNSIQTSTGGVLSICSFDNFLYIGSGGLIYNF